MSLNPEPVTLWTPANGQGEYTTITPVDIVDPNGNFIVDPSGILLVSTDSSFTPTPATVWAQGDGS